jgi:hypothetical protein
MISVTLFAVVLTVSALTGAVRDYVDISRQMLDLSIQQQVDNQAMMARVWEMIDTEQTTEPPATMSREDAVEALRESIRRDAGQ